MEWLNNHWPWYVAGPLIGISVPLLLLLVGKPLGISSSFRHLGSLCSPGTRAAYLRDNDWRAESWNLFFVAGIIIGGFVGGHVLAGATPDLLPAHYASWSGGVKLLLGGLLVGFGSRYADGCTSGHSIMGIANLNWPSLVATCCFFAGGLLMVWLGRFVGL